MSKRKLSIFDLSPSEKLQLVEDLWDDIASTPESVPVYEWQKQELARRKSRLREQACGECSLGGGETTSAPQR
jgi:putative addiction module component (TIGR02574 family)